MLLLPNVPSELSWQHQQVSKPLPTVKPTTVAGVAGTSALTEFTEVELYPTGFFSRGIWGMRETQRTKRTLIGDGTSLLEEAGGGYSLLRLVPGGGSETRGYKPVLWGHKENATLVGDCAVSFLENLP
jgi:hypothetical protein